MRMKPARWRTPFAVAAAMAAAEAGVLLLRPRDTGPEPAPVRAGDYFTHDELDRARAFRRPQRALSLAGLAVNGGALAWLTFGRSGPPALLRRRARRPVLAGAATGAAMAVGLSAAAVPLSAVSRKRALDVGLATQSWPGWAGDLAKAWTIEAAFSGAGGAAGVALVRRFPRTWWAPGAALVVGFGVATTFLGPVLLDPIFNRFTPLPDGRARDDVLELARRAGVDVGEVFEVDASRRTTGANAYVNGIGRTKRVVLFDTLLRDFEPDEVRLVVAHELGHVRHSDVPRFLAFLAILAPAGMLAIAWTTADLLGEEPEDAGLRALPAAALAATIVLTGVRAIANQLSRRIERRTDAFALELTDAPEPFIGFEKRITVQNVAEPDSPRWAELLFGTHPTTLERIGAAVAFRDSARPADRRTPEGS
jgi:Zn-dependent protease with chaperone function